MKNRVYSSLQEVKNLRVMTQCALLIALYLVLNSFSIYVTPSTKFTVSYIALAAISMLAGPTTAFFCGGVVEVLGYLLHPNGGAFHPGITLTTMLTGFVMGLFLYRRELKLWRVIVSRAIVSVVLNLGLNTFWLSTLLGKGFLVMLPTRALKAATLFPLEVALIFLMLKTVAALQTQLSKTQRKS